MSLLRFALAAALGGTLYTLHRQARQRQHAGPPKVPALNRWESEGGSLAETDLPIGSDPVAQAPLRSPAQH